MFIDCCIWHFRLYLVIMFIIWIVGTMWWFVQSLFDFCRPDVQLSCEGCTSSVFVDSIEINMQTVASWFCVSVQQTACLNTTSQTFVHRLHSVASLLIFFSASILKPDLWILLHVLVRSFDNHENFIFINFRHFFLLFFCHFKITLHKTMKKTVTSISCMEYDRFNNLILVDYECG